MNRVARPLSAARLAAVAITAAVGAAAAIVGLALSDAGDDAERAAYLVSLLAAAVAAVLLTSLAERRRAEVARLRADAAVVVFHLRAHAVELAQGAALAPERLAATLRAATQLALEARRLADALTDAGVAQEASELRVAIEAVERSLRLGGLAQSAR